MQDAPISRAKPRSVVLEELRAQAARIHQMLNRLDAEISQMLETQKKYLGTTQHKPSGELT